MQPNMLFMDATDQRAEDCRFAVLKALKDRPRGAHEADPLRTIYMRAHDFTADEVSDALALLESGGFVRKIERPAPAVGCAWQVTMGGVQAYVRR
jgi:hypothetical protein